MGGPPALTGSLRVGRTRRAATLVRDGWPPAPSGVTESGLQAGSLVATILSDRAVLWFRPLALQTEGRLAARRQRGSVNENVAPSPGLLSTHMRPPCISTRVRDTYNPKPDPGARVTVVDNLLKRRNSRACSSDEIP